MGGDRFDVRRGAVVVPRPPAPPCVSRARSVEGYPPVIARKAAPHRPDRAIPSTVRWALSVRAWFEKSILGIVANVGRTVADFGFAARRCPALLPTKATQRACMVARRRIVRVTRGTVRWAQRAVLSRSCSGTRFIWARHGCWRLFANFNGGRASSRARVRTGRWLPTRCEFRWRLREAARCRTSGHWSRPRRVRMAGSQRCS